MRIDKYLWCIRYFKTRNLATEACKKNQVTINNLVVKPSKEVFAGDTISLRKDQINYIVSVLDIPENRVGAKLVAMYCKDETPQESLEHLELLRLSKAHYRKYGEGRPTKKDRRDLEDYELATNPFLDKDVE